MLRAKIRTLESEIETMQMAKREMEAENEKLRYTLDVYIKSADLNENVWDILNEDAIGLANDDLLTAQLEKKLGLKKEGSRTNITATYRRKDGVDAGRMQLQILSRLEIEMNEILSNVLKEEDRQRLLLTDLANLMQRNKDIFGNGGVEEGIWKPGERLVEYADVGIQVDEKDDVGVVDDAIETPRDEALGPAPMATRAMRIKGDNVPYQLRKFMKSFPRVLRIPPAAWVCQKIMSIYFDKLRADAEIAKTSIRKVPLAEHVYTYYRNAYGLEALVDVQVSQLLSACENYMGTLPRVSLFASQIGLYDKEAPPSMDARDTEFILSILDHLAKQNELIGGTDNKDKQHASSKSSPKKGTGGIHDKKKNEIFIRPDISRTAAINTVHAIFGKLLPDGGQEYVIKVKSMVATEKGPKYIDVDEFINVLIEPWHTVRLHWEEHAHYLFEMHCTVQKVIAELQFANDYGSSERDTILMQIQKSSANDCMRRNMRNISVTPKDADDDNGAGGGGKKKKKKDDQNDLGLRKPPSGTAPNLNKEPVCEVLNRKVFHEVMAIVNPYLQHSDVDRIFDEAIELAHQDILRVLEQVWMRCTTPPYRVGQPKFPENRTYYINNNTMTAQWARPYHLRTFKAHDIELKTFVSIFTQQDILAKSPFLDMLHLPVKDLWENAEMFLKQKQSQERKIIEEKEALQMLEASKHGQILSNTDDDTSFSNENGGVGSGPSAAFLSAKGRRANRK